MLATMVQDDARERQLIELFKLKRIEGAGRADTDAELAVEGAAIPFELKSSTDDSVTTVRDFGPSHVDKWKNKHWLIGFYEKDGVTLKYCIYGSPRKMAPWVKEKEEYIRVDVELAKTVPSLITREILYQVLGEKDVYTVQDARLLHKRQYTSSQYLEQRDLQNGYSPERMLAQQPTYSGQLFCWLGTHYGEARRTPKEASRRGSGRGSQGIREDRSATQRKRTQDRQGDLIRHRRSN
jgi:hypothetical protein